MGQPGAPHTPGACRSPRTARQPQSSHGPPGPVLSILGSSPKPSRGDSIREQESSPYPCLISPHWSLRHLILWRGRIYVLQPGRGTLEEVGSAPHPFPRCSALTRTHQLPRERDLSGRESSQQLPRHAGSRAARRQMLGLLTPRMLSAACRFQHHAPLPDTGPILPPRSPRLAADVRHRAPPARTVCSLAPRFSRCGEHQMGCQRAAPDAPAQREKAIPNAAGSTGRTNPLTAPLAPARLTEAVIPVRMVRDPFHGAAGCPNSQRGFKKQQPPASAAEHLLPSPGCASLEHILRTGHLIA